MILKLARQSLGWAALVACFMLMVFAMSQGTPAKAEIVQTFEGDFPPDPFRKWLQNGSDPPARIIDDGSGWDGAYGRVTEEIGSQNNSLAWGQLIAGPFDAITLGMDIRVSDGGTTDGADGFGMAYLNVANFGSTTGDATPGFTEEPNLAGSLGVGFDTFNNGTANGDHDGGTDLSSLSLHWDGALVQSALINTMAIPTFEDGNVYRAEVTVVEDPLNPGEYLGTVSLSDDFVTITPILDVPIPGFVPYDGRMAVAGRTGGAWSDQDIDNVSIQHTAGGIMNDILVDDFSIPDPAVDAKPTVIGGSPYTLTQLGNDFEATLKPDVDGAIGEQSGYLRLTHDSGSQSNVLAFDMDPTFTGPQAGDIAMDFDFRMSEEAGHLGCCNERADGFGFGLFATAVYGETGDGPGGVAWEAPAYPAALTIGFDIFDNIAGDFGENKVRVYWDANLVGELNITEIPLNSGDFQHASINVTPVGPDALLSMTVTPEGAAPVTVFENLVVLGFDASQLPDFRAIFGGRTGGAFVATDLDNINFRPVDSELETLYWDASGSGNWSDTSWLDSSMAPVVDTPTAAFRTVIRTDTVTVTGNESALAVSVESGELAIAPSQSLDVTMSTLLADGASLTLGNNSSMSTAYGLLDGNNAVTLGDGASLTTGAWDMGAGSSMSTGAGASITLDSGSIPSLATSGSVTINSQGTLAVASLSDSAPGSLVKQGGGTLELDNTTGSALSLAQTTLRVEGGTIASLGTDPLGGATTVVLAGGTLDLSGAVGSPIAAPAGAIAYLPFNEAPGETTAADQSGSAMPYDGQLTAGASFTTDGQIGNAAHFDGTDSYITLPWGMNDFSGGITVALFARPESTANWARFIDFGNGSGVDNILFSRIGTTNDLRIENHDGVGAGTAMLDAAGVIDLDEWQHFVATIDVNNNAAIYKDGQLVASGTAMLPRNTYRVNNFVGRSAWFPGDADYQGGMDELYVYDRALSAAEVAVLYGDGIGPNDGIPTISDVDVIVEADSALSVVAGGPVSIQSLRLDNGVLMTAGAAAGMNFDETDITGAIVGLDTEVPTNPGVIDGGSNFATFGKAGSDDLILTKTGTGLGNVTFDVQAGRMVTLADTTPIPGANVALNGGTLMLSSPGGDVIIDNSVTVGSSSTISAGAAGGGVVGPLTATLSNNVTLNNGTLTLQSADNYTLSVGGISGAGDLKLGAGQVDLAGGGMVPMVTVLDGANVTSGAARLNITESVMIGNAVYSVDAGTVALRGADASGTTLELDGTTLSIADVAIGIGDGTDFTFNGNAVLASQDVFQITADLGNQNSSVFHNDPQEVTEFHVEFDYELTKESAGESADGVTFTIQNDPRGVTALGDPGGSLGYGGVAGITPSVALVFNVWNGGDPAAPTVQVGIGGLADGVVDASVYASTAPVNLLDQNPVHAVLDYDGTTLAVEWTDTVTGAVFNTAYPFDIPTALGSDTAYMGFTGATGGAQAVQTIANLAIGISPDTSTTNLSVTGTSTLNVDAKGSKDFGNLSVSSGATLTVGGTAFALGVNDLAFGDGAGIVSHLEVRGTIGNETPATLNLTGDLTLQAGAAYAPALGSGNASDSLAVDGSVELGTAAALVIPLDGQNLFKKGTYTLLTAGGEDELSGTFASVTPLGAYATSGLNNDGVTYGNDILTLTIDKDLHPGDINLDTITDLSDFNAWNANKFLSGTSWGTGDVTGDGITDLSDFNLWNQYKFTQAAGGAAPAPTQVPEPGTLALLACGLLGLALAWRRRRAA